MAATWQVLTLKQGVLWALLMYMNVIHIGSMVLFYYSGLCDFVHFEITSRTLVFFKQLENAAYNKPLRQSSNIFIVLQFPRSAVIWSKCLSWQYCGRRGSNRDGTWPDHGTGRKGRMPGLSPDSATTWRVIFWPASSRDFLPLTISGWVESCLITVTFYTHV